MRPILVGHAVDLATTHHLLPQRRPSPSRRLPDPARPTQPRSPVPTSRSWTRRASTPTPAIPAACPPLPATTSPRSDTADAGTHGHRTPTADTDAGHPDAQTPGPDSDTGRVDRHAGRLDVRTGHWTPAACRGCGHADEGTAGVHTSLGHQAQQTRAGPPNGVACRQRLGRLATMTARRWASCRRKTACCLAG